MSRVARNAQNKQLVETALAAGLRARQRESQTILPTNQRRGQLGQQVLAGQATGRNSSYVVLADNFGTLTEAVLHSHRGIATGRHRHRS